MSNSLAIAAVTATLRNLLFQGVNADPDLSGTTVTTRPPDKARNGGSGNQLNLFLYQTAPNAALRNADMPRQVKPGEVGLPPLALNLFYFLTAYGSDDDDVLSHHLLGRAMSVLHDHPLLGATEIKDALANNDLYAQIERVRITMQPLSLDELSKLWTTFQTQYRITAAYEAAVVLIESERPARAALPVLTRGPDDKGVAAQADLTPPFPAIQSALPPNNQPSARLGDVLTLGGHHLDGNGLRLLFRSPRLDDPIEVTQILSRSATEIRVTLPDAAADPQAPANWPAGFYMVSAVISTNGAPDRTTNEAPLSLAPRITIPATVARDGSGDATLTLTCVPEVRPEQRAALLLGDREIVAEPHSAQTDSLTFVIRAAHAGEFFVRLRVDGIDSLLIDRSVTPPVFDSSQKVKIQ